MTPKSSGTSCPECGRPAAGNFCQHCGADLGGRFCAQCGAPLGAEASFCSQCGAAAAPPRRPRREAAKAVVGGANLPWWIAGATLFGLIVAIGLSMSRPGPGGAAANGAPAAGPAAVDLSSMTPREAADRLYNRVMEAVSAGDSIEAQAFFPMAIAAYERARPLDHDGLFHLSMLQRSAMDLEGALATAREVLAEEPDHLLALSAAAAAARELGLDEEAAEHYRHLLEVYDAEVAAGRPEYDLHSRMMTALPDTARAFLSEP